MTSTGAVRLGELLSRLVITVAVPVPLRTSPEGTTSVQWIERHWYRLSALSIALLPLSLVFLVVVMVRRLLYRTRIVASEALPIPVIVVGNIAVGGTGKTPTVLWLTDVLLDAGYHPGIITRGYGGNERIQAVTSQTDTAIGGDEPVLLAQRSGCPVWTGGDRVAAARVLLAQHREVDVLISDDGLQHYRLKRDIEIAVVDGERGFGNGLLLPAGPLREPTGRLRSVDAVVVNGTTRLTLPRRHDMRLEGRTFVNLLNPLLQSTPDAFRGKVLHAVAGIGNPTRFFAHLTALDLSFTAHPFTDHHRFSPADLYFPDADAVLMTEKDAVRCAVIARENFWCLPVAAKVDSALADLILDRLKTRHGR